MDGTRKGVEVMDVAFHPATAVQCTEARPVGRSEEKREDFRSMFSPIKFVWIDSQIKMFVNDSQIRFFEIITNFVSYIFKIKIHKTFHRHCLFIDKYVWMPSSDKRHTDLGTHWDSNRRLDCWRTPFLLKLPTCRIVIWGIPYHSAVCAYWPIQNVPSSRKENPLYPTIQMIQCRAYHWRCRAFMPGPDQRRASHLPTNNVPELKRDSRLCLV